MPIFAYRILHLIRVYFESAGGPPPRCLGRSGPWLGEAYRLHDVGNRTRIPQSLARIHQ